MKRPVRVLLIDDNRLFTDAVELIVGDEPRFSVVGIAPSLDDALHLSIRSSPDVVLLDVDVMNPDPVAAMDRIRDGWPQARVVVMSSAGDAKLGRDAISGGAADYLRKTQALDELLTRIKRATAPAGTPSAHAASGTSA